MRVTCWALTAAWLVCVPAHAQQRVQETVVVTGTAAPVPFQTLARTVRVITREEVERLPVAAVSDLLRMAAGVDVRARGSHGVQADFSVRGASFGQALVLLDGVRLNNAQTGHHNGDWPVALGAVERIEVLLGPGSSLYGADAFGGTVNIVTRGPGRGGTVSFDAGDHGLARAGVTAGFAAGRVRQTASVDASRSSGFEFAREFRTATAAARTTFGGGTAVDVGVADKAFGANGFYGNSPSKEWTQQVMVSAGRTIVQGDARGVVAKAAYRTHRDRFLWDVRRPGFFENRHRTHAASVSLTAHAQVSPVWRLAAGAEHAADWIRSSNLGDHELSRSGVFGEGQATLGPRATIAAGLRLDRYTTFGTAWSPSFSGGLWVSSSVRVRASLARAFRVPTFTERFYRDPAHAAEGALSPERAWSGDAALDWVPHPEWMVVGSLFERRERDAIDWVKAQPQDLWRTRNIRRVRARGFEFGVRRAFGEGARVSVDYAYTDVTPSALDLLSKYTLDYARHGLSVGGSAPLPAGLWLGGRVDLRQRTGREAYTLVDLRVSRAFGPLSVRLDAANLLDVAYQEVRGVNMPGRRLSAGVEWRLR